jgi:hypothetical protein
MAKKLARKANEAHEGARADALLPNPDVVWLLRVLRSPPALTTLRRAYTTARRRIANMNEGRALKAERDGSADFRREVQLAVRSLRDSPQGKGLSQQRVADLLTERFRRNITRRRVRAAETYLKKHPK